MPERRWGSPRRVRLDGLKPERRLEVIALVNHMRAANAAAHAEQQPESAATGSLLRQHAGPLVEAGWTYQEVADWHGVSRQRVHQVVTGYRPPGTPRTAADNAAAARRPTLAKTRSRPPTLREQVRFRTASGPSRSKSGSGRRSKKSPDCWLWRGSLGGSNRAYGQFRVGDRILFAHRVSWMLAHEGRNARRDVRLPPLRQPALRASGPPLPRHSAREHPRHDREGSRRHRAGFA